MKTWKSINENLAGFLARWAGKETVPFGIKDRMLEIDKTK